MQTDVRPQETKVSRPTPTKTQSRGIPASTALLPARLFLGIVFLAAGLDKLTDPEFFDPATPGYIGKQLAGFATLSPISSFLSNVAVPNATLFGWLILLGEIAIGLGTLVGLFSRTAAFFGFVVSLILWLSTSWATDPFYLGADLPYAIAFLVLAIGGAHPVFSLDGQITRWLARQEAQSATVAVATNQSYPADSGPARPPLAPAPLETEAGLARRRFIVAGATLAAGTVAVVAWGNMLAGRNNKSGPVLSEPGTVSPTQPATPAANPTTPPAAATSAAPASAPTTAASNAAPTQASAPTQPATTAPAKPTTAASAPTTAAPAVQGPVLGTLAALPAGSGKTVKLPDGNPALLIRGQGNEVRAFSAICTHEGCIVSYSPSEQSIVCPCHGAMYDPNTGAATRRPARLPLSKLNVKVDGNGNIVYVQA